MFWQSKKIGKGRNMKDNMIDQTDYIESAVYLTNSNYTINDGGPCSSPCNSCGGGCYGCKGSSGAEIFSEVKDMDLSKMINNILD